MKRVLCWFSCGAASAVAAKLAIEKYGSRCEVIYCDTLAYEHHDNRRFLSDVERWIGVPITLLRSEKYSDIYDVFDKTGYLVGPNGARCTTELKKLVRRRYQKPDDIHVLGYTVEEKRRIERLSLSEPDLCCDWILRDNNITKRDTLVTIKKAGIELPAMYKLGYKNNNCIGCVKGQKGYWNKIRVDFPDAFQRMAEQERKMNVAINKSYSRDGKRIRVFLDELPPDSGNFQKEPDIECGILCLTGNENDH